jgi:hypothetical protein
VVGEGPGEDLDLPVRRGRVRNRSFLLDRLYLHVLLLDRRLGLSHDFDLLGLSRETSSRS